MPKTTLITISSYWHDILKRVAKERGTTMKAVMQEAFEKKYGKVEDALEKLTRDGEETRGTDL